MRYLFEISYRGTNYAGWQSQHNAVGVQAVVEKCLGTILRTKVAIVASGRTDTGVHCEQQFFHVDLDREPNREKLVQQLNSFLPADIAVRSLVPIQPTASARYDATERSYRYVITREKDPLLQGLSFYYFKEADIDLMNRAASHLLGTHDFQSFSKVKTDVNHFICTIKHAEWNQKGHLLVFSITANRFLRGMVRAVTGTLLDVGSGKIGLKEFQDILKSRDRKKAGMNVPAEGLFLTKVKYPKAIFIE